jgi:hypothetical protein
MKFEVYCDEAHPDVRITASGKSCFCQGGQGISKKHTGTYAFGGPKFL